MKILAFLHFKSIFICIHVNVSVCVCAHMRVCVCPLRLQGCLRSLGVKLQATVVQLLWMLGTEFRSSAKASCLPAC